MDIKIIDGAALVTVALSGKLDIDGVKAIEEAFKNATAQKSSIIDLSNVEYLASLGIRIFLQSAKAAQRNGHKMVLLNPRKNVLGVIQLANLDSIIPVVASLEEVAKYL